MNNEIYLAALRREVERSDPERRAEIEEEIARVEKLPAEPDRPAELEPETSTSRSWSLEYLEALEREKTRSEKERHAEIDKEIARVKAELRSGSVSRATADPTEEADDSPRPTRRTSKSAN